MENFHYLFGPVPSRRFGRSLGVDLTPPKTCSFDCIFCQLGRTTQRTVVRREYVPTAAVIEEIRAWFRAPVPVDVMTLAGSGEPTLHTGFGEILRELRKMGAPKTLLLSNGSLFSDPEVRRAACEADIVKLSLSAWDDASLARINRPAPGLSFAAMIEGMRRFRSEFAGELRLEVFLVAGLNTFPEDVARIAEFAGSIQPDRIQLNTAVRPPAEATVSPVTREEMEKIAAAFRPKAEIIGTFRAGAANRFRLHAGAIAGLLRRRPCSLPDLSAALGLHPNEISKYLGKFLEDGLVRPVRGRDGTVFVWNEAAAGEAGTSRDGE